MDVPFEVVLFANGWPQKEQLLLTDLNPMTPEPKNIPIESKQLPNESRRIWKDVTQAILDKKYNEANKLKQDIEDRQRKRAAERKDAGKEWRPRFFTAAVTPVGRPDLTDDGRKAIQGLQENKFDLDQNEEYGA